MRHQQRAGAGVGARHHEHHAMLRQVTARRAGRGWRGRGRRVAGPRWRRAAVCQRNKQSQRTDGPASAALPVYHTHGARAGGIQPAHAAQIQHQVGWRH